MTGPSKSSKSPEPEPNKEQDGSACYPCSRNVVLRCCSYSLPVTPQMLLLAVQRLSDGKGAEARNIVFFVQQNFPVVVSNEELLEEEVRRKLALCVETGVLDIEPATDITCTCDRNSWFSFSSECEACERARYKPPRDIACGRLDCARLQQFYAAVVEQLGRSSDLPPRKKVGLWWHQRLTRRIIETARNLAAKVADTLDSEDDCATQTDNMVTDWVNPSVADADYIN